MTTIRGGPGAMLLVTRRAEDELAARFVSGRIIDFKGARRASAAASRLPSLAIEGLP
jgi:hypothetical protein